MTMVAHSLRAARQLHVAERDGLHREHAGMLLRVEGLIQERGVAAETLACAQRWMSASTQPGTRLNITPLKVAHGFVTISRSEIATLEVRLQTAQTRAEQLRLDVAMQQSKVRTLDKLILLRRAAWHNKKSRREERELDRDAAGLATALSAVRSGLWMSPQTPETTPHPQEYSLWR
jgi:hypothetical protein